MDTALKGLTVLLLFTPLAGCITGPDIVERKLATQAADLPLRENTERMSHYSKVASALYAKANEHIGRAERYGTPTGYARIENDLQRHCIFVAGLYREAADSYQKLAGIHEQATHMRGRESGGSAVRSPRRRTDKDGVKE